MTERHLAKLTGVSQPHMHNVLKGIRALSLDISDRILSQLHLSVRELCATDAERHGSNIPIVRDPVGPGQPFPLETYVGTHPFTDGIYASLVHPAVFRLAPDPAMEPELVAGDFALVDRTQVSRANPVDTSIYLTFDSGCAVMRYACRKGQLLCLATSLTRTDASQWRCIDLAGRDILEVIRGRIVWIGRQMEKPARPADEACPAIGPACRTG